MFHNSSTRSVANVPDITMICSRASSVVRITTKDTNITGLENSNRYTRGYLKEFQRQVLQHTLDTVFKFCRHFVSIMKKKRFKCGTTVSRDNRNFCRAKKQNSQVHYTNAEYCTLSRLFRPP